MIEKAAGKLRKPLPGYKDQDGGWQTSREQIAGAWQRQFANTENADPTTMTHLRSLSQPCSVRRDINYLKQIPTLYDLERSIRGMSDAKSPGVDGIGAELLQMNLVANAQRLYALLLKTAIRGQTAAEMCGGWLVPLFKGKGSQTEMSGYRAILLEPTLTRTFSRSWRRYLEPGLQTVAAPMQWGGRGGLSIEGVHLQAKLWMSNARAEKASIGLLFVDLRSAFYTVVKPLLASAHDETPCIPQIFQRLNLPPSAYAEFCANVEKAQLIRHATRSDAAEQMVGATLRHTWFLVESGDAVFAPQTGSRPGDPIADMLFGFLVSRIMGKVQQELHGQEQGHDQELIARSIAWVDDMVFHVQATADQLTGKVAQTCSVVVQVCAEHGLSLSVGANKTAIMLEFHGKGAIAARQQSERQCKTHMPVVNEHHEVLNIPIVNHYRHLGSYLIKGGSFHQEIKIRAAQAFAKLQPLQKITKSGRIDMEKKRILVRTMALSVLSLHTGSWFDMGLQEFQTWQAAVHKLYMAVIPRNADGTVPHKTHHEAAMNMQSPMAMELLHVSKLRLLVHLIAEGDAHIHLAVIHNWEVAGEASWLASVQRSATWMQDQIGEEEIPTDIWQLHDFEARGRLQSHHRRLKKLIYRAMEAHQWRLKVHCEFSESEKQQRQILKEMGWECANEQPPEGEEEQFPCSECGQTFATAAAAAVHEAKKHHARIAVRRYACDGVCRICKRCFHTRTRLMQHWHYGTTRCWYQVMRKFVPMSLDSTQEKDDMDKKQGTAFHQHGLKPREQDFAWRLALPEELEHSLALTGQDGNHEPTVDELATWRAFGLLPVGQGGRDRTVRKSRDVRLCNVVEDTQKMERALVAEVNQWTPHYDYVPRPLAQNMKYILVFFSGHRREGDIVSNLQGIENIQAIPIDLAISTKFGNVLNDKVWIDLARARRIIAAQAGPPCETYTEARWLPPPNGATKPRPLRNSSYPWGMILRSLGEVRQGAVGSILFLRTLYLLVLIWAYGGAFVLEHPKGPASDQERWCIWHSAMIKRLQQAGDIQKILFIQGPLGQPFAKPTTFLSAKLPHIASAIYSNYDKTWRPSMVLGGVDPSGKGWKTSAAKAYPRLLCQIIAQQFAWYVQQVPTEGSTQVPEELDEVLCHLCCWDPYIGQADEMQGDYHRFASVHAIET